GTNITLSAWIKTTQGSEGNVFAANDSASAYALLFGIQGGNPYRWDGADEQYPPAVNDGQWHMLTYVRNGSTGYIYVDGVQRAAYSSSFTWTSPVVTRWSIGQEWDSSPSDFYNGLVDDVRIYNKALTADEVKQLTRGDLLRAWNPSPNNRLIVDVGTARQPLTWSPGDKASQHDVYFGLDKDAVGNAGASDTTGIYRGRQSARSYSPPEALAWGTGPYYWRIDEVNTDGTVTTGSIWSFSVAGYLIVDDIESYNDIDPPNAGSNRVFDKWVDGFGTTTNGALVGNNLPPYAQRSNVHGGGQAMPLSYDNNRKFSEATLTRLSSDGTAGRDWTREGVANLSLWL
ncbi:MAG: LamG domain-containing protein, partial [Planctomycetota bacterium]